MDPYDSDRFESDMDRFRLELGVFAYWAEAANAGSPVTSLSTWFARCHEYVVWRRKNNHSKDNAAYVLWQVGYQSRFNP